MTLGEALRQLAEVVDRIDETGAEVIEATPETVDDGGLTAEIRVRVPTAVDEATAGSGGGASDPRRGGNGKERHNSQADRPDSEPDAAAGSTQDQASGGRVEAGSDVDPGEEREGDDERGGDAGTDDDVGEDEDSRIDEGPDEDTIPCPKDGCSTTFDSEHGMRIHRSKVHGVARSDLDARTLQKVYERYDSFTEMRDALGANVTAQTIRRWMMDRGIHAPGAGAPGSDPTDGGTADGKVAEQETADEEIAEQGTADGRPSEGEQDDDQDPETTAEPGSEDPDRGDGEPVVDDRGGGPSESGPPGAGGADDTTAVPAVDQELPGSLTATELRETVDEASTLYEVQRRLDLERDAARELLSEFDLLELVHGRIADRARREELKAEIDERLRTNVSAVDSHSD